MQECAPGQWAPMEWASALGNFQAIAEPCHLTCLDMVGHEFQVAAGLCNLQLCHSRNWQPGVEQIKIKPAAAALASQQRSASSAVSAEPTDSAAEPTGGAGAEEPSTFALPPGFRCRNAWNVHHVCSPFCLSVPQVADCIVRSLTAPGCGRSYHAYGFSQPRRCWSHRTGTSFTCARG